MWSEPDSSTATHLRTLIKAPRMRRKHANKQAFCLRVMGNCRAGWEEKMHTISTIRHRNPRALFSVFSSITADETNRRVKETMEKLHGVSVDSGEDSREALLGCPPTMTPSVEILSVVLLLLLSRQGVFQQFRSSSSAVFTCECGGIELIVSSNDKHCLQAN